MDNADADIEFERSGNVLTLEFENRTKVIVNLQPPKHEIWLAAKAGGFHYKYVDGEWRDTRNNTEFFATLTKYATRTGRRAGQLFGVSRLASVTRARMRSRAVSCPLNRFMMSCFSCSPTSGAAPSRRDTPRPAAAPD